MALRDQGIEERDGASALAGQPYHKPLDGLRAVLVMIVVLAHLEIPFPRSGGPAVDVFFVLSGFLITGLISTGVKRKAFRLKNFYVRRILRLSPALLAACLFVTVMTFLRIGDSSILAVLFAATYTTNFAIAMFGANCEPLGHCWSLAIEEQYYLLWPFVVLMLERVFRNDLSKSFVILLGALGIVAYRVSLVDSVSAVRLNFAFDTRIDSILFGGCLAYIQSWLSARQLKASVWAWGGALMLALCGSASLFWVIRTMHWTEPEMGKYGYVVCALSGCAVINYLTRYPRDFVGRLLSISPIRYIGKISYGIYVFHPLVNVMMDATFVEMWLPLKMALKIVGGILVASINFELVERRALKLKERFRGD